MKSRFSHEKRSKSAELIKQRVRPRESIKSKPAKASKYLHHLKKYHKKHPDIQAIIYTRGSSCAQGYQKNPETYEKVLRRKLKKLNIPIVSRYREINSGWILEPNERWSLREAATVAKKHIKNGKPTVIVAASSDRFLRNINFNTKNNPDALPTVEEFEKLKELTFGVPLLTLLHPNMPPQKVRHYQAKWGQQVKGNKGGRPSLKPPGYKKRQRDEKLPLVRDLYRQGKNPTQIARKVQMPRSTVCDWITKMKYD